MRPPTACQACRSRRRKCEIPVPGNACTYCIRRRRDCSAQNYEPHSPSSSNNGDTKNGFHLRSPIEESIELSIHTLSIAQRLDLVRLYFEFCHDKFHSIFHRPSVMLEVSENRFPEVLLSVMIALAARFSADPCFANVDPKSRGEPFARYGQRLHDLRDISLMTIQASILMGSYVVTEGEAEAESVYYCAACRMARVVDLPNIKTSNELEREVNIRVWWTLCMIDVWSSSGVNLPRQMPHCDEVPMPMDEIMFLSLTPQSADPAHAVILHGPPSSLLTQMIKVNRIFAEINDINERAVTGYLSGDDMEDLVRAASQRLDDWHCALPKYMHDNQENLSRYAAQGLGSLFVAVYLGYYHYRVLLYYQFLHEDCYDSIPNVRLYAAKCADSAASLCTILYASNATPGCEMLHTMLGHVIVIASTVQIHTLLFNENETAIAMARTRLERNFEILIKLRKFWPTLDVVFTRLHAFHKACHVLRGSSFRMDQWMLKYLSEFARPVDDREEMTTPNLEALFT